MATCTAICLLGKHDRDHGGIQLMHMIRLYQNSKDTICIDVPSGRDKDGYMLALWHSTSNALDDMMLMGARYALQDERVIQACREAGLSDDISAKPWGLYSVKAQLPLLYQLSKEAYQATHAKLVIISLKGSQMTHFMESAKNYHVDLELCPSVYERNSARR